VGNWYNRFRVTVLFVLSGEKTSCAAAAAAAAACVYKPQKTNFLL
jgi:hypothetical protein